MLQVQGADKLARVAKELKQIGDHKVVRSELYRGMTRAAQSMVAIAKKSPTLSPGLPRRGGLAALVAGNLRGKGGVKLKRRTSGANVGIQISGASAGHDIRAMERGRLRHPVHGRKVWVSQDIQPGFWSKPLAEQAVQARKEVVRVIDEIAKKIGI